MLHEQAALPMVEGGAQLSVLGMSTSLTGESPERRE